MDLEIFSVVQGVSRSRVKLQAIYQTNRTKKQLINHTNLRYVTNDRCWWINFSRVHRHLLPLLSFYDRTNNAFVSTTQQPCLACLVFSLALKNYGLLVRKRDTASVINTAFAAETGGNHSEVALTGYIDRATIIKGSRIACVFFLLFFLFFYCGVISLLTSELCRNSPMALVGRG